LTLTNPMSVHFVLKGSRYKILARAVLADRGNNDD
jgi:hypothetical protein